MARAFTHPLRKAEVFVWPFSVEGRAGGVQSLQGKRFGTLEIDFCGDHRGSSNKYQVVVECTLDNEIH